jgi:pre-mRNA-processing factor 6
MLGDRVAAKALLNEGLQKFPTYPKLWIMMADLLRDEANSGSSSNNIKKEPKDSKEVKVKMEISEDGKSLDSAREAFKQGVKNCPTSIDLWLAYADMEAGNLARARSILETARLKVPKNQRLWLAAVRIEQKADNQKVAQQQLAKALQECPTSGILWAHAIASDPRPAKRSRSFDALKKCTDDPHVFCAVAKLFWIERKTKKARDWFIRAITVGPNEGDIWAAFYKFEAEQGEPQQLESVIKRCVEAEPRNGDQWKKVKREISSAQSVKPDVLLKRVAESMKDIFETVGGSAALLPEPGKV